VAGGRRDPTDQRRRLALGSVEKTVVQKIALIAIVDQADNSTQSLSLRGPGAKSSCGQLSHAKK
jgi:hypothetical protein